MFRDSSNRTFSEFNETQNTWNSFQRTVSMYVVSESVHLKCIYYYGTSVCICVKTMHFGMLILQRHVSLERYVVSK